MSRLFLVMVMCLKIRSMVDVPPEFEAFEVGFQRQGGCIRTCFHRICFVSWLFGTRGLVFFDISKIFDEQAVSLVCFGLVWCGEV